MKKLEFYINNFGDEEGQKLFDFAKTKQRERNHLCIEYYLKRGYTEDEGRKTISQKQSRNKNYYLKKYGQIEGEEKYKRFREINSKNLENYIKKFGKEEGTKRYEKWCKNAASSYSNFIKRYGLIEGEKRFKLLLEKRRKTYLTKSIEEQKIINESKSLSLKNFIKKFGEKEGTEKYDNHIKSKKKWYIKSISKIILDFI